MHHVATLTRVMALLLVAAGAARAQPQGQILFHSYSSNAQLDEYEIVDAPGTVSGPSNWTIAGNGYLQEDSNI